MTWLEHAELVQALFDGPERASLFRRGWVEATDGPEDLKLGRPEIRVIEPEAHALVERPGRTRYFPPRPVEDLGSRGAQYSIGRFLVARARREDADDPVEEAEAGLRLLARKAFGC